METFTDQRSIAFLNEENRLFSLENDDFHTQHPNRIPLEIRKDPEDLAFQEIFLGNPAPKITTISVSTRSNKSYDVDCMSQEFFFNELSNNQVKMEPLDYDPFQISQGEDMHPGLTKNKEKKFILDSLSPQSSSQKKSQELENLQDETKNIPKNYIKAIFTFILENTEYIEKLFSKVNLTEQNSDVARFLDYVRTEKKTKRYTIQRLKSLWLDRENGKAMRIISFQFLRKRSLSYIFGSRIERKMHHIKHRSKFIKAVGNPSEFTNIK